MVGIAVATVAITAIVAVTATDGNAGGYCVFGLLIYFSSVLYVLPSIIAFAKRHPRRHFVLALNILLGWLVVPWILGVIWACRQPDRNRSNR